MKRRPCSSAASARCSGTRLEAPLIGCSIPAKRWSGLPSARRIRPAADTNSRISSGVPRRPALDVTERPDTRHVAMPHRYFDAGSPMRWMSLCRARYVLRQTMRMLRHSPCADIAWSPVTMSRAPAARAHSGIRWSGSPARTASDSAGSTSSPSSERKTATRASASRSWTSFRAGTERSSSRMGPERASGSSPSTILRSASSPRPPGTARADTSTFVSNTTLTPAGTVASLPRQDPLFLRPPTPVALQGFRLSPQTDGPCITKSIPDDRTHRLSLRLSHPLCGASEGQGPEIWTEPGMNPCLELSALRRGRGAERWPSLRRSACR